MKKMLVFLLVISMVLSLSACGMDEELKSQLVDYLKESIDESAETAEEPETAEEAETPDDTSEEVPEDAAEAQDQQEAVSQEASSEETQGETTNSGLSHGTSLRDKIPSGETTQEPESQEPEAEDPGAEEPALCESQVFSTDAGTSIDVLREEFGRALSMFGMAYIGYYDGTEELEFRQWYEQTASPLITSYQFIYEIDEAHTIGTSGHLYVVVAPYDSSIEITTIDDNKVLYRSENGDPVLIFCNRNGDSSVADTTVTVKAADGTECTWMPTLDPLGFPDFIVGDQRQALSYDFRAGLTFGYEFNPEEYLRDGWLGANSYGLAGDDVLNVKSWTITMWDDEKQTMVNFSLTFCPNPSSSGAYDGEAIMECFYENGYGVQANWQGWWRIETEPDQPTRLEMDLMLMYGDDMEHYEDVPFTSESYWVMMHPNGEVILLVPETGYSALPFMGVGVPGVEMVESVG